MNTKDFTPWIEKYRPNNLDDIVYHDETIKTLKIFLESDSLPHLLFYGPSGTGKTSTIMACVNLLYGNDAHLMIMHLNASNERGINIVRDKIGSFVTARSDMFVSPEKRKSFKIVILDEIDSMTFEAQGMLRQIIETHARRTRFCLICNEIDKVNSALQSRCVVFRFSPLNIETVHNRLLFICKEEKLKINNDAIKEIVKTARGDLRKAINILECACIIDKNKLTLENVIKVCRKIPQSILEEIFNLLISYRNNKIEFFEAYTSLNKIIDENNVSLPFLVESIREMVIKKKWNKQDKMKILIKLSEIELYDSVNTDFDLLSQTITAIFCKNI